MIINLSTPVVFRGSTLRNVEPSSSRLKWQVDVKTLSQPHPPQPPQQEQSQPVKPPQTKPPPTKPPLQPQSTTRPTLPISLRDGKGGRGPESVKVDRSHRFGGMSAQTGACTVKDENGKN